MTIEATLLERGERLIWCDRPHPLRYAWQKGRLHAAAGVVAMVFIAQGLPDVLGSSDLMALLAPVVFLVIGMGLVLQPMWHFYQALHATYVLTDRRVVIDISGVWPCRLNMPLSRVPFTEMRMRSAGFGDVIFRETAVQTGEGMSLKREGFIAVANVQEVDRTFRRALERAP